MDLYEELLALVDRLAAEGIDYALCGGVAVAFHGHPRFTKDIDILLRPEDVDRTLDAIATLGFDLDAGTITFGTGTPEAREVRRVSKSLGPDVLTLDILLVSAVLEGVWATRGVFAWRDREIRVVSREGLVLMKRLAGRDQDLLDAKLLEDADDASPEEG
jgi:hypothetical protein